MVGKSVNTLIGSDPGGSLRLVQQDIVITLY